MVNVFVLWVIDPCLELQEDVCAAFRAFHCLLVRRHWCKLQDMASLLLDDARHQHSKPWRLNRIRLRQGVYFTETETRARLVLKLAI